MSTETIFWSVVFCLLFLIFELLYVIYKKGNGILSKWIVSIHLLSLIFTLSYLALYPKIVQVRTNWELGIKIDVILVVIFSTGILSTVFYVNKKHLFLAVPVSLLSLLVAFVLNNILVKQVFI